MKKLSIQEWGRMIHIRLLLKDGTKSILLTKDLEMIREHISMNQEITFKPILRLIKDMTEEENAEFRARFTVPLECECVFENEGFSTDFGDFLYMIKEYDWLDSKGFDIRNWIKLGLAVDAREVE